MTPPDQETRDAAEKWLKDNDLDYQKYGDKRADRSAYDTRMNYEISSYLDDAFSAGAAYMQERILKLLRNTKPYDDGTMCEMAPRRMADWIEKQLV